MTETCTDEFADMNQLQEEDLPAEALCRLMQIELPRLAPGFGLRRQGSGAPEHSSTSDAPAVWALDIEAIRARLQAVLDDPVQTFIWRGNKKVLHVLRQWVLVVWPSGRITALEWHAKALNRISLRPVSEPIDLFHLGTRTPWLMRHRDAVRWEQVEAHVEQGGKRTAHLPRTNNSAIFLQLQREVNTCMRLTRLDARIRCALDLDTSVLQLTLSCMALKRRPSDSEVRLTAFNWVVSHRQELEQIKHEAPGLLQWFVACATNDRFPTKGVDGVEPVQRLKHYLRSLGMRRSGWRLLLQHGHVLMKSAALMEGHLLSNALHLLKTHVLLGSGRLVPSRLLQALERHLGALPLHRDDECLVLTHLVDLWMQNPPASAQDLQTWTAVLQWLQEAGIPRRLNAVQRRLGLGYLVRRAAAWEVFKHQRYLASLRPLYVWHEPIVNDGWELTFMRTRDELRLQAESMGCFGDEYIPRAGFDTLFARVMRKGEHLGTAHFRFADDRWTLDRTLGRFYDPFDAEHEMALENLAKRIRRPIYNLGEKA
jgi:hypothetical protein